MLQFLHQLHGPLLYTLQYDHVSLVLENSEWTQWSVCGLNSAELRGRNISLNLLAVPIQIPRVSLCYFLVFFSFSKFHFWFTFSSLTTRTTQICFCRFTFQLDGSQHVLVPEVVLPQVQDCISPCWTSWCSSQSHSPAWQCLSSGWHHDYLVHLLLHLVLCHLKTCWGYTLFHPPKVNENVKHFQSSSLIVFHIYQLFQIYRKAKIIMKIVEKGKKREVLSMHLFGEKKKNIIFSPLIRKSIQGRSFINIPTMRKKKRS